MQRPFRYLATSELNFQLRINDESIGIGPNNYNVKSSQKPLGNEFLIKHWINWTYNIFQYTYAELTTKIVLKNNPEKPITYANR